jgi:hypothetical protein
LFLYSSLSIRISFLSPVIGLGDTCAGFVICKSQWTSGSKVSFLNINFERIL